MFKKTGQPLNVEELQGLPLFEGESPEAIAWMASHMECVTFDAGEIMATEGDELRDFAVVLSGELHFQPSSFDALVVAPAGTPTGVLPFSRLKTWAGRGWAAEPTRVARMDASHLRELVYRAPVLAQRLVAQMTDRTREYTRMQEGSARLLALGKLSAGLAHELNNPAAAAVRSAARLRQALHDRREVALTLRTEVLPPEAHDIMRDLGAAAAECAASPGLLNPLEREDRESELSTWLEQRGVTAELAGGLVDAGIGSSEIEPLVGLISSAYLTLGLRILVLDHEVFCLTREIEEASRRVSDLVQAMKTYSYMDQSSVSDLEIEQGLDATLRIFQHRLKQGVALTRDFSGKLPKVRGNGSALNQVWTNLIDNALDAMESLPVGSPRELRVRTCVDGAMVMVEVADSGPGIPESVQQRMFEPFFTTKTVGKGTGLGLDIVQRIVRSHKGFVRCESHPGRTLFQVRLPAAAPSTL